MTRNNTGGEPKRSEGGSLSALSPSFPAAGSKIVEKESKLGSGTYLTISRKLNFVGQSLHRFLHKFMNVLSLNFTVSVPGTREWSAWRTGVAGCGRGGAERGDERGGKGIG